MATKPKTSSASKTKPKEKSKAIANASTSDWRPETLARMRALIEEADPAMVEERKWKKPSNGMVGVPVFSHNGIVCTGETYKDVVKLTFAKGASLADPGQLFNASLDGGTRRAIDIREGDKIEPRAFKALIKAAVAHNGEPARERKETETKARAGVKEKAGAKAKTTASKAPAILAPANARKAPAKKAPAAKAEAKAAPKEKKPEAAGGKVRLLSGGNPQMAKGEGDTPVQAYIAAIPEAWKQDIARRLDALVVRAVPKVRKAMKWNSPFYGLEGQGYFLSFHIFTHYVKVTFFKGQSLNPIPPGQSKDKNVRYADIHDGEWDQAQMTKWVKQAAALPGWMA